MKPQYIILHVKYDSETPNMARNYSYGGFRSFIIPNIRISLRRQFQLHYFHTWSNISAWHCPEMDSAWSKMVKKIKKSI